MSVALLTAQELGCFVAIAHQELKAGTVPDLCDLAVQASAGNAAAFSAQYHEPAVPCSFEDIAGMVSDYMVGRRDMVADHFGPVAYNLIDNDGHAYSAPGVEVQQDSTLLASLTDLERRAKNGRMSNVARPSVRRRMRWRTMRSGNSRP